MTTAAKSQVLRFSLLSKNVLSPDQLELYELSRLAGITMDPTVFKLLVDLLRMNVAPTAIVHMLKSMTCPQQLAQAGEAEHPPLHSGASTGHSRTHKQGQHT